MKKPTPRGLTITSPPMQEDTTSGETDLAPPKDRDKVDEGKTKAIV